MEEQFLRTAMLLGEDGVRRLQNARVAVFGLRQLHERETRVESIALKHLDGRNSRQKRLRGRCG